jgi:hypothetical protein
LAGLSVACLKIKEFLLKPITTIHISDRCLFIIKTLCPYYRALFFTATQKVKIVPLVVWEGGCLFVYFGFLRLGLTLAQVETHCVV